MALPAKIEISNAIALYYFLFLLALLAIASAQQVVDRGVPFLLASNEARGFVSAALATLVNTISVSDRYSPRSISDTIFLGTGRIFIRLWFFSDDCHATPDPSDSLPGFILVAAFRELHDRLATDLFRWGYSYITVIDGRYGMEYSMEEGMYSMAEEVNPAQLRALDSTRRVVYSLSDDCFPYANMVQSGPRARVYSRLLPNQAIWSPNQRYKLAMERHCEAVLYDGDRVWATPTRDRADGCFLLVQQDGNLVVVNHEVRSFAFV
ncbi:hypothetical protein SELMODRAFT_411165 [Selaginella moellendorffii]|uniref:Bulb-type lectin domain-containing protein n=1 Tax=Selaginella moellendorffii TaxID=88036 RepID=D8RGS3_SELML|nr:hypothetical protein SELMODRAFT_411165 [Selaginella moellendorffii]